jgi:diadenosine tetraphosphatase ApaH/serine/threonine PP2A family protein phosphatase
MTDDLLKYYVALQPKFREVMGNLRDSDDWKWSEGDAVFRELPYARTVDIVKMCKDGKIIYLPRTIDDSSEEARKRSLVGMLTAISKYRVVLTELTEGMWHCCLMGEDEQYVATTLSEAILKALCAQWEVEV